MRQSKHHDAVTRREAWLTVGALVATLAALVMLVRVLGQTGLHEWHAGDPWTLARFAFFTLIIAALLYGNFVYLIARLGYELRRPRHGLTTNSSLPKVTSHVPR